jgi:hypothetical protein
MYIGRERSGLRRVPFWAVLVAVTFLGGTLDVAGAQGAGSQGALVGRTVRGPLSPVGGLPGVREGEPVVGARVQVTGVDRTLSREAVTDHQGDYRLDLPAGSYQVTIGRLRPGEFTKSLPAKVTITAGSETRLDIWIDTGIR